MSQFLPFALSLQPLNVTREEEREILQSHGGDTLEKKGWQTWERQQEGKVATIHLHLQKSFRIPPVISDKLIMGREAFQNIMLCYTLYFACFVSLVAISKILQVVEYFCFSFWLNRVCLFVFKMNIINIQQLLLNCYTPWFFQSGRFVEKVHMFTRRMSSRRLNSVFVFKLFLMLSILILIDVVQCILEEAPHHMVLEQIFLRGTTLKNTAKWIIESIYLSHC